MRFANYEIIQLVGILIRRNIRIIRIWHLCNNRQYILIEASNTEIDACHVLDTSDALKSIWRFITIERSVSSWAWKGWLFAWGCVANDRRTHVSQIKSKIILFANKRAFSRLYCWAYMRVCGERKALLCVCVKRTYRWCHDTCTLYIRETPEICACRTLLTALNTHHTAITFPNFVFSTGATRVLHLLGPATSSIIRLFAVLRRAHAVWCFIKRRYEFGLSVLCM